jgi:hypothetical protein
MESAQRYLVEIDRLDYTINQRGPNLATLLSSAKTNLFRGNVYSSIGLVKQAFVAYYDATHDLITALRFRWCQNSSQHRHAHLLGSTRRRSSKIDEQDFLLQQRNKFDKRCRKITNLLLIALCGMCQIFYKMEQLKNAFETQQIIKQILSDVVESNTEIANYVNSFEIYFTSKVVSMTHGSTKRL